MTLEDLGRRAVACKHWRWMPGMYIQPLEFRVVWFDDFAVGECDQISYLWDRIPDAYPDLSDPATLGCLLALVREAWGDDRICVAPMTRNTWGVVIRNPIRIGAQFREDSEAASLVAALEAAP